MSSPIVAETRGRGTDRAEPQGTMRGAVIERYGGPEQLVLRELPRPVCGPNQVMVRVRAAGLNPIDWRFRNGSLRFLLPARFPLVLGFDIAGELCDVGSGVRDAGWQEGDAVLGFLDSRHGGGYAEYAVASPRVLARKPEQLSFAEAAAIPLAASTALQALRDRARVGPGDRVLINGASGGVGTFAVQIARILGAEVTAVCGGRHHELCRELGAHSLIDYARDDFTKQDERYQVVFDAVGKSTYGRCRSLLPQTGWYITTLPSVSAFVYQLTSRLAGPRCQFILVRPRGDDLRLLADWIESGRLRPIVQQTFPLERAAEAHRMSEAGHVQGKLVLLTD